MSLEENKDQVNKDQASDKEQQSVIQSEKKEKDFFESIDEKKETVNPEVIEIETIVEGQKLKKQYTKEELANLIQLGITSTQRFQEASRIKKEAEKSLFKEEKKDDFFSIFDEMEDEEKEKDNRVDKVKKNKELDLPKEIMQKLEKLEETNKKLQKDNSALMQKFNYDIIEDRMGKMEKEFGISLSANDRQSIFKIASDNNITLENAFKIKFSETILTAKDDEQRSDILSKITRASAREVIPKNEKDEWMKQRIENFKYNLGLIKIDDNKEESIL